MLMRIVVMGTGPFAVPSAEKILQLGHQIPLVVTRPLVQPVPKKLPPRPVADWATANGLPLYEPASINSPEAITHLTAVAADLFFVCDYGQILSSACLTAAKLGGINLHGSLLPRHRGAAPVQWTLLSGDEVAGVTVIHMTPKLDGGPTLAVRSLDILPDENAAQLEQRLAKIGVSATVEAIELLGRWDGQASIGQLQDRSLVTKAPRFSKQDGQLDFRKNAEQLERQVRACQPWPGTYADLVWPEGKSVRLLIRAARALPQADVHHIRLGHCRLTAGAAVAVQAEQLGLDWTGSWKQMIAVGCAEGLLLISRIQPAGKREMDAAEFMRGHPLLEGAHFALP
jgi:methionyl-tRNA formyltransferase